MVAVCDLVEERAEAAAARFGAKVYPTHRELIERGGVDAVFIFIPPFAHEDQEILAARRGIPFFVEKPVARTTEKAREVDAVVRETGVMTSVGYNWRYQYPTERAKEMLGDATIGMVMGYWVSPAPRTARPVRWSSKMALGGSQMLEQTTHIADMFRYFGGEVKSVYCRQALRIVDIEGSDAPDVGTVMLEFESGAIGTITNGRVLPRGGDSVVRVFCPGPPSGDPSG